MRACVQRVSRAAVTIAGESVGRIDRGLLVLLGVAVGDSDDDASRWRKRSSNCACSKTMPER